MLHSIMLLLFSLLLSACHSNSMPNNTKKQSSLDGMWLSKSYGYVLSINGQKKTVFDVSQKHCFDKGLSRKEVGLLLTDLRRVDEQTMQAKLQAGITDYFFSRIEKLPDACNKKYHRSHAEAVQYFIDIMDRHYAYFGVYGIDWPQRVKQIKPLLKAQLSAQQAYDLVVGLLAGINDGHVYVAAEVGGEARVYNPGGSKVLRPALDRAFEAQSAIKNGRDFRRSWFVGHKKNIESQLLQGQFKYAANDKILWGKIGETGYINLLRMMGLSSSSSIQADSKAFEKHMNTIMADLKDTTALVIDVTTNSGGHDEIGLLMAGYFIDQPTAVYSKQAHGSERPPQLIYAQPGRLFYNKPIYLLTSDHTVSAAETFVMAMKNLPQVTHVGDATRGAFSDVLDKPLPNGWEVGLSNEIYRDRAGRSWEGQGLQPQWPLPVFAGKDIHQSHIQAIKLLLLAVNQ